jgi:hypothetical protein
VRAVFGVIHTPNNADTGTGSLREVLGIVSDGDKIVLPAGQTITLETPLPPIIKSILIEGNGAVLTQTGFTESNTSQLLYISGATAEVRIGRLHFKGGRAVSYGGAIQNTGVLILESCIFSDNKTSSTSALGGAIHTNRYLTVSGCTFYGNNAGTTTGQGGAIYGSATLTGNVFWGNTASYNSVVYGTNTTTNGFNISDKASGTDISTGSGWIFGSTDKRNPLPVSPLSLRPVADGALAVITTQPANYPAVDFYGVDRPGTNAAAGAIQTAPLGSGYILDYGSRGPGAVSVQSGTVDGDGLISGSVTLAAAEEANGKFMHWTVDGAKQPPQSSPAEFTVIADDHKTVRGVFYTLVTDTGNDTPGSLREALSSEDNGGGVILPAGQTIALTGTLPSITKDLIIEGNGTTLTQNGTGRFLGIGANAVVRINRLHFKESKPPTGSGNSGGAITNSGALILESCIFSGNRTGGSSNGGAVYNNNTGSLTVLGCTFNENNAGGRGGAIFNGNGSSAVILIGNIFQANIASSHKVVYSDNVLSYGYNVSDRASGIAATSSGWTFSNGDIQMADVNFNADFVPSSASLPVISLPLLSSQEFPALYFNGTSRGSSSAPGAMPPAVEP